MESRYKYGVLGAGAVGASLIGQLPARAHELGPVSAVSYRVASRIANTLRAGFPVRTADELNQAPCVLFHAPPEHIENLLEILERAKIDWTGKALVFCDCDVGLAMMQKFAAKGASTAAARQFGIPGRIIVEGAAGENSVALHIVHRIARELRLKAIEISPGATDIFDAAFTLGSGAITPLIDRAAALLRESGIRDIEAARIASALFEQTARDYAHSGKQSWAWYVRKPRRDRLEAQIAAAGPMLRQLLLFSFEAFGKHAEIAEELTQAPIEHPATDR